LKHETTTLVVRAVKDETFSFIQNIRHLPGTRHCYAAFTVSLKSGDKQAIKFSERNFARAGKKGHFREYLGDI
jgi:hypothetical protein